MGALDSDFELVTPDGFAIWAFSAVEPFAFELDGFNGPRGIAFRAEEGADRRGDDVLDIVLKVVGVGVLGALGLEFSEGGVTFGR